jgi:hypothetical protein
MGPPLESINWQSKGGSTPGKHQLKYIVKGVHPLKVSIDRVKEAPPLENINLQCKGVHPLKTSIDRVKEGGSTPGNHQHIV